MSVIMVCDLCEAKSEPAKDVFNSSYKKINFSQNYARVVSWDLCPKCYTKFGLDTVNDRKTTTDELKDALSNFIAEIIEESS